MRCGNTTNSNLRFTRKNQNQNERALIQNYWKEITQLYGTFVDYFVYDYQLSAHDFFYGEHPLAPFKTPPVGFPILAEFQNDSLLLSKFGIQTEADVVFIIPIQTFYEKFGNSAEPKSGDVIRLTELGWDRPGSIGDMNTVEYAPLTSCNDITNPLDGLCKDGVVDYTSPDCTTDTYAYSGYDTPEEFSKMVRGAHCYEITERRDENLTLHFNPLQGHYVWICHAKRFDYSYQPNAPREPGSVPVSDETRTGLISTDISNFGFPAVSSLPMSENIRDNSIGNQNVESNKEWNYTNRGTDSSVYGDY